ncbi:CLUMA_CG000970, isoform A [Clunio marinus]|uniref:CLUMA_CG000970, isoform A n=1 Tax=Clunio marinus TaxID=568069 RepID=A0A1J1HHY3_9DIPT|nr:CLUMA_CG000970, isoform A [Clunio marinus]
MFVIKMIAFAYIVSCINAEPPRRRSSFRQFARQEVEEQPESSQGYNYDPPAGERLRLPVPVRFRQFARQEDQASNGYDYPKPTDSYGPPEEETTEDVEEITTEEPTDEPTTINSDAEELRSLQATQFRRKNSKLIRSQKLQAFNGARQVAPISAQPVYYIQYSDADLVEPQYYYVFK